MVTTPAATGPCPSSAGLRMSAKLPMPQPTRKTHSNGAATRFTAACATVFSCGRAAGIGGWPRIVTSRRSSGAANVATARYASTIGTAIAIAHPPAANGASTSSAPAVGSGRRAPRYARARHGRDDTSMGRIVVRTGCRSPGPACAGRRGRRRSPRSRRTRRSARPAASTAARSRPAPRGWRRRAGCPSRSGP